MIGNAWGSTPGLTRTNDAPSRIYIPYAASGKHFELRMRSGCDEEVKIYSPAILLKGLTAHLMSKEQKGDFGISQQFFFFKYCIAFKTNILCLFLLRFIFTYPSCYHILQPSLHPVGEADVILTILHWYMVHDEN